MARVFKIADLQTRKRALVAESEVYRQTLALEVRNVQLYSLRLRKKFAFFSSLQPLVFMGVPLVGSMLRRRKRRRRGLVGTIFLGLRLYRQFAPMLLQLLQGKRAGTQTAADQEEAAAPAANI